MKFWGSKQASLKHKLSSYRIYVTTVLMHGYESWHLNEKALKILNGFDIRAQMQITGWDYKVVIERRQFVLTHCIRVRRLAFLGQILRLPPTELCHKTMREYHLFLRKKLPAFNIFDGTIFMDAPKHSEFAELVATAEDRTAWRGFAKEIQSGHQRRRFSGRLSGRIARPQAAL